MHTQHARGTTRTLTPLTKARHETKRTDADRAPLSLCTVHAAELIIINNYSLYGAGSFSFNLRVACLWDFNYCILV